MKAFVTGSTGLLGSNIVRLLLEQGHEVKALARSRAKAEQVLGDTTAEIVIGDMANVTAFAPQLAGCDVLFHCAAYFREYYRVGDHWPALQKINVDGVVELLQAVAQHGLQKAFHVSSSGVIGMPDGLPGDEFAPPGPISYQNMYFRSKILAEAAVQESLNTHEMDVVMILPGWMMGPRDAAPIDSGQIILDLIHQELPGVIDGGNSIVDVRDVAQAMIAAVEHGRRGERYIAGGSFYTLAEVSDTVASVSGTAALRRRIPYWLVLIIAWLSKTIAQLRNTETATTINGIRTLRAAIQLNSSKSQNELGVTFRPLAETIADEIAWFASHGYLKRSVKITAATSAPKLEGHRA